MLRLFKISAGVLTGALLIGLATPAWGVKADQRRAGQPAVCPLDSKFQDQARVRRLRDPAACQLDLVLQFLGIDTKGCRLNDYLPRLSLRTPGAQVTKGTIQSVYPDKQEFVLRDNADMNWTFLAAPDCKVFINNREAKLANLQNGDEAVVDHEIRGLIPMVAVEIRCSRK